MSLNVVLYILVSKILTGRNKQDMDRINLSLRVSYEILGSILSHGLH